MNFHILAKKKFGPGVANSKFTTVLAVIELNNIAGVENLLNVVCYLDISILLVINSIRQIASNNTSLAAVPVRSAMRRLIHLTR